MDGTLGAALRNVMDTTGGSLRGWPVSLRQAAVRHVQHRVRRGHMFPCTPHFLNTLGITRNAHGPTAVAATVDWMMRLARPGKDDDAHFHRSVLHRRIMDQWAADADVPPYAATWREDVLDRGGRKEDFFFIHHPPPARQLDETALHAWVEQRYGPSCPADWERMRLHLDHLTRLLVEATRHGREHWTDEQRMAYGYQPEEVQQNLAQERCLFLTEDDYRADCMRRMQAVIQDPLLDHQATETLTGESQLRPRTLYPDGGAMAPR